MALSTMSATSASSTAAGTHTWRTHRGTAARSAVTVRRARRLALPTPAGLAATTTACVRVWPQGAHQHLHLVLQRRRRHARQRLRRAQRLAAAGPHRPAQRRRGRQRPAAQHGGQGQPAGRHAGRPAQRRARGARASSSIKGQAGRLPWLSLRVVKVLTATRRVRTSCRRWPGGPWADPETAPQSSWWCDGPRCPPLHRPAPPRARSRAPRRWRRRAPPRRCRSCCSPRLAARRCRR